MYIAGIAAFALLFINDFNDWKIGSQRLKILFPIGSVILVITSVKMCFPLSGAVISTLAGRVTVAILCIPILWAEVYSLFFSFDRDEAYTGEKVSERRVYTARMYALCRHPGVLFFIILYSGLWLVTGMTLFEFVLLSGLNLLLAVFEDLLVFPAILGGYSEYKQRTPFMIPNISSIAACIADFRR